jgi:phosphatidate cytidylyltransferase
MLKTRLWMGFTLAGLALGALVLDQWLAPWFPFLFLIVLAAGALGGRELIGLLERWPRPRAAFTLPALLTLLAANWVRAWAIDPWPVLAALFAVAVLGAFLVEMYRYTGPGDAVMRVAFTVFGLAYLGLLPAFFVQLRWLADPEGYSGIPRGTLALTLAIFVPKCCDIGAYFTGRLIGRHRMTPLLSPKKTWEGAVGGLVTAAAASVFVTRACPAPELGLLKAVLFGLVVGLAGLLGDLAESLIKRDGQKKDASQAVPGFGGVLDVIDAVVFAAPVAYLWLVSPWTPLG